MTYANTSIIGICERHEMATIYPPQSLVRLKKTAKSLHRASLRPESAREEARRALSHMTAQRFATSHMNSLCHVQHALASYLGWKNWREAMAAGTDAHAVSYSLAKGFDHVSLYDADAGLPTYINGLMTSPAKPVVMHITGAPDTGKTYFAHAALNKRSRNEKPWVGLGNLRRV